MIKSYIFMCLICITPIFCDVSTYNEEFELFKKVLPELLERKDPSDTILFAFDPCNISENDILVNETFHRDASEDAVKIKSGVIKNTNAIKEIDEIFSKLSDSIKKINVHYHTYLNYATKALTAGFISFAENALAEKTGVQDIVVGFYKDFIEFDVLKKMNDSMKVLLPNHCDLQITQQQYFYKHFLSILHAEIKTFMITEYAMAVLNRFDHRQHYRNHAADRISSITRIFNFTMSHMSRELWKCDPEKHNEGKTFERLSNVRRIFLTASDFSGESSCESNPVNATCPRSFVGTLPCVKNENCFFKQRPCRHIKDCSNIYSDLVYGSCIYKNQESGLRYSYVKELRGFFQRNVYNYGLSGNICSDKDEKTYIPDKHNGCRSCTCMCEDVEIKYWFGLDEKPVKYFSSTSATSDQYSNNVVTGVKFVRVNNTFYLQVQQSKLLPGGLVKDHPSWRSITLQTNIISRQNLEITLRNTTLGYKLPAIYLDDMELPENEVITGVRFVGQNNTLMLDVRSTPFNKSSGQLFPKQARWHNVTVDIDNSQPLKYGKEIPIYVDGKNKPNKISQQIAYFNVTDFTALDAGQNLLPFLDIQPVTANAPLCGINLDIKSSEKSGGYLMPKIKTCDVTKWLS